MLTGLRLDNIALIDSLELAFEQGFTVMTGETGAGKSILLDALDALLGGLEGVSGSRLLRAGSSRCYIEASFSITNLVNKWLSLHGFDLDGPELLISREWRYKDDRCISRTRLNGITINKNQVLGLRPLLIDLTAQGHTQFFSKPSQQLGFLDYFGGSDLEKHLLIVKEAWSEWQAAFNLLEEAKVNFDKIKEENVKNALLLSDLETASLTDPEEIAELEKEQDRLVHFVHLHDGIQHLILNLYEGSDQIPSLSDQLGICVNELQSMVLMDNSLSEYLQNAMNIQESLQDLIHQVSHYEAVLESDPSRLEKVQQRLSVLKNLQRSHNLDLKGLIQLRNNLSHLIDNGMTEQDLCELEKSELLSRQKRNKVNNELTLKRQKIAAELEDKMIKYLKPMGLKDVRFQIQIESSQPSHRGEDKVNFLFSANPGQSLAPLSEVASGGEMSRFLLALKTLLSAVDGSSTLLFDEIDSGVSGRVSKAIASLLKELSINRQVFCITHQPLIAAAADHHFVVSKVVKDDITYSNVSMLTTKSDREQELAELAGGDLAEARIYAASLLEQLAA